MQLEQYPERDGRRVWLDERELADLLEVYRGEDVARYLALGLAGRSGLRRSEVVAVRRRDLVDTDGGLRVRVQDAKAGYRETPVPASLFDTADTYAQTLGLEADDVLVDVAGRTLARWVTEAAACLEAESGDDGWRYVGPHDLRRSWGTNLLESDVSPWIVMEWGGWEDWATFRDNYLGAPTASKQREEQGKVDWL